MFRVTVAHSELISVDERKQRGALKLFYQRCILKRFYAILNYCRKQLSAEEKTKKKLAVAMAMAHMVNPLVAILFIIIYWIVGMHKNMNPEMEM